MGETDPDHAEKVDALIGAIQTGEEKPRVLRSLRAPFEEARIREIGAEIKIEGVKQSAMLAGFLQPGGGAGAGLGVDEVRLHWREIVQQVTGKSHPGPTDLGPWQYTTVGVVGMSEKLLAMSKKIRENMAINVALEVGVGIYPKVLYCFEWRTGAPTSVVLKQELKGGFVRGK
jgi:hypothetical protein